MIVIANFFIILLIFFAIFGITDIIRFVSKSFFCSKKLQISNCNEAEYIIRSIVSSHEWPDFKNQSRLICRYSTDEKETKKIIKIASNNFGFIKFEKNKNSDNDQCDVSKNLRLRNKIQI